MKKQLLRINPGHNLMQVILALILTMGTVLSYASEYRYSDSWGKQGLSIKGQSSEGISLNFSMQSFAFEDRDVNGATMQTISFSESLLPNEEGNPDLPGFGRYIAIPQGATPILEITSMRTERFANIDIAPAPRIPLDTDDSPLYYAKNQQIYSKNAFFPSQPVTLNNFTQIRGVDVCMLNILPYQYNPVTKELIVYRDIEVSIRFEGGSRQFGESRYRNAYFDQILEDVIFNYASLPVIDYDKQVANKTRSIGYDYLIIVPNDPIFSQWADSIKNFRNEEGIYTGVVKLSDIGTNVTAVMLESYINNAYNTWDIPPTAVLLLADYGQAAANANSIISPIYDNYCVSDNMLADVNGDHMPEMVFARITANNAAQLQSMVSRFMNYERNPPTNPSFYANPVTALGWQTVRWFQICSEVVGGFWKNSMGKTPVRINEIYEGATNTWSTAQNTSTVLGVFGPSGLGYIPASPTELGGWSGGNSTMINNALNAGAFMLMHRDHGAETLWGEPAYSNSNINALTNTDLTWILSMNCLTGKYNWNSECFTEKFHRHTYNGQPAGALGLTAASETSYSFVNDTYVWGMMDNMWPQFMPQYGSTPASRGVLPAFAHAAGKYFLQQSSWPYNTGNKEVTYNLFHHHGDAFVRVCTEVPQNIVATYEPTIFESDTSIIITTAANAKLCISVYGTILATATTGMTTTVTMTIPAQLVGTQLKVTITKPNCNRYEGYITVIPDVTSAYAGEDIAVCADQTAQLTGNAVNYQSLLWETSGTGVFDDATVINPVYTPGSEDIIAGSVVLSLTASKPSIPDSTDYMTLTLAPVPVVFAGNETSICEGDAFSTVEATASNYTQLYWSTSGTGVFGDVNSLSTRYTPSAEDIIAGSVVLTLNVSNDICEVHTSSVPVVINPRPVVSVTGPAEACQNQSDLVYISSGNSSTYQWEVLGGTITSAANESEVTVTWNEAGAAMVNLIGTNEFGCTESTSYEVTLNPAPVPAITGNAAVCANSTDILYSTPIVDGNTYSWQVEGGAIASGNASNELLVNWGANGNGIVTITETNSINSCTTTQAYNVTIESPVAGITEDTTICVNHTFVLKANTGYASYLWSTGGNTASLQVNGEQIGSGNQNTYTVTVTDVNGCTTVASSTVTVEACLAIPERLTSTFTLYPNPNTGEFNISFNETLKGNATVTILNATGSELFNKVIKISQAAQVESFNVSNLSSGIYFIKVDTNNGSTVQKLIIN